MRTIDFTEKNHTFVKPDSMTDEECTPIETYVGIIDNKMYINTVWQPNYDDIKAINAGRPVVLSIFTTRMIPVSLFTFDENGQINQ